MKPVIATLCVSSEHVILTSSPDGRFDGGGPGAAPVGAGLYHVVTCAEGRTRRQRLRGDMVRYGVAREGCDMVRAGPIRGFENGMWRASVGSHSEGRRRSGSNGRRVALGTWGVARGVVKGPGAPCYGRCRGGRRPTATTATRYVGLGLPWCGRCSSRGGRRPRRCTRASRGAACPSASSSPRGPPARRHKANRRGSDGGQMSHK